jgi:hypothetical protein
MPNDGDEFLNLVWAQCEEYVRNEDYDDRLPETAIVSRTGSRVAQALTVMAFGPEILLLG